MSRRKGESREEYLARCREYAQRKGPKPLGYYQRYNDEHRAERLAWQKAHPPDARKAKARAAVSSAIRSGRLVPADSCERCGKVCKTQAHHESYDVNDWLKVNWVCGSCNQEIDAERNAASAA